MLIQIYFKIFTFLGRYKSEMYICSQSWTVNITWLKHLQSHLNHWCLNDTNTRRTRWKYLVIPEERCVVFVPKWTRSSSKSFGNEISLNATKWWPNEVFNKLLIFFLFLSNINLFKCLSGDLWKLPLVSTSATKTLFTPESLSLSQIAMILPTTSFGLVYVVMSFPPTWRNTQSGL